MSGRLQDAIQRYLDEGYQIAEQLSPTSVTLFKKRLIGRKWLFLWIDDHSNVQVSKQRFRDLTKKLAKNVRLQKVLEAKMSWTEECVAGKGYGELDLFSRLLVDEEEKNDQMLTQLKEERSVLEKEIRFRNCLGNMVRALKEEVERCLNAGYELKSHTGSSAVLERRTPFLETLNLCVGSAGGVQRSGKSCKELQKRLDLLISMFKLYRTGKPTPGREKQVLNKQFELDAEINALHRGMKYLGYTPNLREYKL